LCLSADQGRTAVFDLAIDTLAGRAATWGRARQLAFER
jgi:hypothetical protein